MPWIVLVVAFVGSGIVAGPWAPDGDGVAHDRHQGPVLPNGAHDDD
jgi:hypothetical protein